MDLAILSVKDSSVRITTVSDIPKERHDWEQIACIRKDNKFVTEFVLKGSMNWSPGEFTRNYPLLHQNNVSRRVRFFCNSINHVHFREVEFSVFMHPRYPNRFQLMTMIEKYIDVRFKPSSPVQVDVMSRMHKYGNE